MSLIVEEPTLLDNILYYGLLVGAIFQLACIFAVIYIPQSENEEEQTEEQTTETKPSAYSAPSSSNRRGKKEKKKHR